MLNAERPHVKSVAGQVVSSGVASSTALPLPLFLPMNEKSVKIVIVLTLSSDNIFVICPRDQPRLVFHGVTTSPKSLLTRNIL